MSSSRFDSQPSLWLDPLPADVACDPVTVPDRESCIEIQCASGTQYIRKRIWRPNMPSHSSTRPSIYKQLIDIERSVFGGALEGQTGKSEGHSYQEQELFTIKYSPKSFSQLLSNDAVNIELLKWLGKWKKGDAGRECPVMLLTGPPGLGKTTVAHLVAKTVGYNPLEINASDERSGESLINRITSIVTSTPLFNQSPACVIIDEIDGAVDNANSSHSLISFLVKLVNSVKSLPVADDDEEEDRDGPRSAGKGKTLVRRPIICICNDLYAPALRPLRSSLDPSRILHVKRPAPTQLASRLKDICEEEGFKADMRAIVHLCDHLDCDIRSSLNALQFISKRSTMLTFSTIDTDLRSWKDSQASPLVILESVFSSAGGANASQRRLGRLLDGCDDKDRIVAGCFEAYQEAKFFDNSSMDRVNSALDWLSWYDHAISAHSFDHPVLMGYGGVTLLRMHSFFSSPAANRFQYPRLDYELSMEKKRCDAIVKAFTEGLPVQLRRDYSEDFMLTCLIPFILESLKPNLSLFQSSTSKSLIGEKEKAEVVRIKSLLKDYGLALKQQKGHGESFFTLEPPIDRLMNAEQSCLNIVNDGASSKIYSIFQIVYQQMIASAPKRAPVGGAKRTASKPTTPLPQSKRQRKDFFGRPVDENEPANSKNGTVAPNQITSPTSPTFWYRFNEGYSNAVRREVRMQQFYDLLK